MPDFVSSDRSSYNDSGLLYIHRHFLRFGAFLILSMTVAVAVLFLLLLSERTSGVSLVIFLSMVLH